MAIAKFLKLDGHIVFNIFNEFLNDNICLARYDITRN